MARGPEMLAWETPGTIASLTRHLRRGAIVALPTETLYGLSCVATDASAVKRLAILKGIPPARGFVALVARCEMLEPFLAAGQDPRALSFLRAVWPAPLSAILAVRPGMPWAEAQGGGHTAAFRVPAHGALLQLLSALEVPLVSTSANRTGEPPLGDGAAIAACFAASLAAVVVEPSEAAAGARPGLPSTLADFTRWPPVVRRAGAYDLQAALGVRLRSQAPGAREGD